MTVGDDSAADWLVRRHSGSHPLVRLITIPGAGAGAGWFRGWDRALPGWIELWAVSAPGRERRIRAPAPTTLEAHVDGIVSALTRLDALPLALLGHSMGAVVAWEVARRLRSHTAGHRPRILFLAGMVPPGASGAWAGLSGLSDDGLLDQLRARFGGFPGELDRYPELRSLMLETVRRDLQALDEHTPAAQEPLDLPIRLLAGREDRAAPPDAMRGWAGETTGTTRMAVFEARHDFMAVAPEAVIDTVVVELREMIRTRPSV